MIVILGHKLIMQKGDDTSFRIILIDHEGKKVPLAEGDRLVLRLKSKDILFRKESTSVYVTENGEKELYHIINFNYKDTINLSPGDYSYDVILESDNIRYTVITTSPFVLEESISLDDIDNNTDGLVTLFENTEGTDFTYTLSSTPLIGKFSHVSYIRTTNEANDDLLLF